MEVPLKEELTSKRWWYDPKTKGSGFTFSTIPEEQKIEITTRRRLFAPTKRGLGHIIVEGFIFEHCGNQYPTNFGKKISMPKKVPLDWKPDTIGSFGIIWFAMPKPLQLIVAEWMGILPTTGIHMIT